MLPRDNASPNSDNTHYSVQIESQAETITLKAYPPLLKACFELLKAAGAEHYALFGGSVRDSDYAARNSMAMAIKDYDLRIWLPEDGYETQLKAFLGRLETLAGLKFTVLPAAVNQVHYVGLFQGVELDVSVRPIPAVFKGKPVPVAAVAMDRARRCDVGISAVAIDSSGQAWAMPEYLYDQTHKTLTISSLKNSEGQVSYAKRMLAKYPDRVLVCGTSDSHLKARETLSFFALKDSVTGSDSTEKLVVGLSNTLGS